ncbi:hypothetical protein ACVILL_001599 [Bradyrhizobium sp. USDA 3364]
MRPNKFDPAELEQSLSPFRVRPGWYDEYWLKPEPASGSARARRRRSRLLLHSTLYAAIASVFVYMSGSLLR